MEVLNTLISRFLPSPSPGQDSEHPLDLLAVPGLMTLLDQALYRSAEGQLTATTCSGHALLQAWLDLKQQSQLVLTELKVNPEEASTAESFARACLEASWDATERLSTDKLAYSANLSDPYDNSTQGGSNHVLSGVGPQGIVSGVLESKTETGRRFPSEQRRKDCWESSRLFCPDYVWADDVVLSCQRLLRNLNKHSFYTDDIEAIAAVGGVGMSSSSNSQNSGGQQNGLSTGAERHLALLLQLIKDDLPIRLHQFRSAVEADSVVCKRLYLVKCEYRAPFRAFLEAHQSVQRAPSIEIVDEYLSLLNSNNPKSAEDKRDQAKQKLQQLLDNAPFKEALAIERKCEELELALAQTLFPFTEMARMVEHKRARLMVVPNVVDEDQVAELQELLRVCIVMAVLLSFIASYKLYTHIVACTTVSLQRLKYLLCRRAGPETSTGIRPLLLDIRGVPRDEDWLVASMNDPITSKTDSDNTPPSLDPRSMRRLQKLVKHLQMLGTLMNTKSAFHCTDRRSDIDFPANLIKGCCEDLDTDLVMCQVQDYFALVNQQTRLVKEHDLEESLEASIRQAEMELSIAAASDQSLGMVRQRLELLATDREKRSEVLKQMVEEVCLREMNLFVELQAPEKCRTLLLQPTSALGLFGKALVKAGEPLPIG